MRYPYIPSASFKEGGNSFLMPFLPLFLDYKGRKIKTYAMLDTGSTVNVLPFSVGLSLGVVWENQNVGMKLAGNLATTEARGILLDVIIEDCPAVTLAFAWAYTDNVPLLFGQTNFFDEFDVLFSRSSRFFDVSLKGKHI
jgi:hypothetical protein